jgi:hypothetical protein
MKHFPRRRFLHLAAGAAALPALSRSANAQIYPARPITIVVPLAPGGATDVIARMIADRMRQSLGQPVIIENVTGANGSIGVGRVARARPDGYTLSIGHWATHVVDWDGRLRSTTDVSRSVYHNGRSNPVLFGAVRVLDLDPIPRWRGLVGRGKPLRYDPFEAHRAGLPDHQFAPGVGVLVERDTNLHAGQQPRQAILALAERQRPIVDPVKLQQGSWLNLVEGFFSKLARSLLRHIRVSSKQELKDRLMAASSRCAYYSASAMASAGEPCHCAAGSPQRAAAATAGGHLC